MLRLVRTRWALAAFAVFAIRIPSVAQSGFQPIPPSLAPKYHMDFARNFFASPEEERSSRNGLLLSLSALQRLQGHVTDTPENLRHALEMYDRATARLGKHTMYLYARYAVNTKDTDSNEALSKLDAEFRRRTSFLQQELMRLDAGRQTAFAAKEPAIKRYSYVIEAARRLRTHTLSLKEEELLNAASPLLNDWQAELYQQALDRTKWAKLATARGEMDVWRDRTALSNSPDRSVREAAFKDLFAGYSASRDLYAFALRRLVKSRNQVSQFRHYRDNPEEAYFALYLTPDQVRGFFERLAQAAEFNKRYQRLRVEHLRKITGYETVNIWDLNATPPGQEKPRFDISQASQVIRDSLAPLGPDYARELAALLDPANGRMDIVPGENRVPGAFAWGFPGAQISFFYSFNFEGYLQDVVTLAHEAGHAVHFQLMGRSRVMPVYADGPRYFTESFAMFNELLVADHLYRTAPPGYRKTVFLEEFLNNSMRVFGITRVAALEQNIYDAVAADKVKGPDDLDALAQANGQRFSIWFDRHPEMKLEWIDVHHLFDNPMYYVNYVYANFLALKYYEMFTRDPKGFVPRYLALMRNGFNAPPAALLKRFLGVDLKDPKLVNDAFAVLESKIKALESAYAEAPAAGTGGAGK